MEKFTIYGARAKYNRFMKELAQQQSEVIF